MHYMKDIVAIDFETYSAAPLPEVGLANYVNDPTFVPLMCGIATEDSNYAVMMYDDDARPAAIGTLEMMLTKPSVTVVAHNAGFERAVLRTLGIDIVIHDSAVVAAVAGANRHLAGAAQQLLDKPKLDGEQKLMRLFSIPKPDQVEFDTQVVRDNPHEWQQYIDYCIRDAELSRQLFVMYRGDSTLFEQEMRYAQITLEMNDTGWPVDMESVRYMRARYQDNLDRILGDFRAHFDPELNLNSTPQLMAWCADRGVRMSSFDKEAVDKALARLERKTNLTLGQQQVRHMLGVKQQLGGSSLKKLDTILATQHNGRLYDQYVHAGAAQSLRTSGRGVQMQNLKRLSTLREMHTLADEDIDWDNEDLADNLRQVFCAEHESGLLFVADFSAIESRALAYLAGEQWKLHEYTTGNDVYKAQAMKIFGLLHVDAVTKEQRQTGKVGELSCGYGAGPVAVRDFASKMGVVMSEDEAKRLVWDWRDANPQTVQFWTELQEMLAYVVQNPNTLRHRALPDDLRLEFSSTLTPRSLLDMNHEVQSVQMCIYQNNKLRMRRVFHGCYMRGGNIGYYKPSSLKTGDPWKRSYTDPKTGLTRRYELYGGKLAGILTQSFCREIFFECLSRLHSAVKAWPKDAVKMVGQFHDEVILEWTPGLGTPAVEVEVNMRHAMSTSLLAPSLPMAVEVKWDRRYVK